MGNKYEINEVLKRYRVQVSQPMKVRVFKGKKKVEERVIIVSGECSFNLKKHKFKRGDIVRFEAEVRI